MGVRGALNTTAALMAVVTVLFAFFSYSSKAWVEGMETTTADLKTRVIRIEEHDRQGDKDVERRLTSIEQKIDKLIERGR